MLVYFSTAERFYGVVWTLADRKTGEKGRYSYSVVLLAWMTNSLLSEHFWKQLLLSYSYWLLGSFGTDGLQVGGVLGGESNLKSNGAKIDSLAIAFTIFDALLQQYGRHLNSLGLSSGSRGQTKLKSPGRSADSSKGNIMGHKIKNIIW